LKNEIVKYLENREIEWQKDILKTPKKSDLIFFTLFSREFVHTNIRSHLHVNSIRE